MTEVDRTEQDGGGWSPPSDVFTTWLASSALRIGMVLVGVFLLLAALGQLSGFDILGLTADLLTSSVGGWILIAVLAIGIIVVAVRGFPGRPD